MRPDCAACCFFRLVETKGRRRLCMFTGEKRPYAGMDGCCFIAGTWSQLDAILGLPKGIVYGNTDVPNQTKSGNDFSINGRTFTTKKKIDLDDFSVKPIYHIAQAKRRFTDPVPERAGGSFGRGVCKSPLCI